MDLASRLCQAVTLALAAEPESDRTRWPYSSALSCAEAGGAAKSIQFERDLLRLAGLTDLRGKTVLDVGSGFGIAMMVYALLGATEVHGIEYMAEAVEVVDAYLPALPAEFRDRIHSQEGDAADIPYPVQSFDVLCSAEAISHYFDPPAFLAEAARVLRPGGLLLISDCNNGASPIVRRRCRSIWRAFEEGHPGTQIGDHIVRTPYVNMRREVISGAYPELDGGTLELLARNTAGWTSERVLTATARFLEGGVVPDHPYRDGELAIAPFGMAMERTFEPFKLAREIESFGFRARAYGYWGGAAGQPAVRAANRVLRRLSRWTMPLARAFQIVARRLD